MVTFMPNDPIVIGDPEVPGANTRTTWGIPVVDPPQPLPQITFGPIDPLTVWKSQPSVRKVVDFIARNVASIPWHAYVREADSDRRRVAHSPAEQKLMRPRRFLSGFQLWRDVITDSCLYDLWCVALIGDDLQRISPRLLTVDPDPLGNIRRIGINTARGIIDITELPLAIGTGWSPLSGVGVSPMITLQNILSEQSNAVAWRNAQWKNGPKMSGVLKRPAGTKWDPQQRDRFLESWRQWRDTQAGGTPILEDGMEYVPLNDVKPADAKDIEGRQLTDVEVASAFHIAPELVGAREGTFANVTAFRQMLFGPALGPRFEELQQAVNSSLAPALDTTAGIYVELDRESAMNGSFTEQAQVMSTAVGAPWLTRNEARAKQNLPAVDGGDELITPLNVTEGGLASPRDTGSQNVDPNAPDRPAGKSITVKSASADVKRENMQDAIARVYRRQLATIKQGDKIDVDTFHDEWDTIMADAVHSHMFGAAVESAQKTLDQLDAPEGVWSADKMRAYVRKMADTTAGGINAGVSDAVNADEWPVDADNPDDAKAGLEKSLVTGAAVAWAASALADSSGFGSHDAAGAAGAATKQWIVTSPNPRQSHMYMDGETVSVDSIFSNGLRWPGDMNGSADETAGCTCELFYE